MLDSLRDYIEWAAITRAGAFYETHHEPIDDAIENTGHEYKPGVYCCSWHKAGHYGLDYPVPAGTTIYVANNGTVVANGFDEYYAMVDGEYRKLGMGNYVIIETDEYYLFYLHMRERSTLAIGTEVSAGDIVGYVGTTGASTGNHLHFEVRIDRNDRSTTIDPRYTYIYGYSE